MGRLRRARNLPSGRCTSGRGFVLPACGRAPSWRGTGWHTVCATGRDIQDSPMEEVPMTVGTDAVTVYTSPT